jgi:hypothetical protein
MVMVAVASAKGCAEAKVRTPCTLIEPTQKKVASINERASACVRARRLAFLQTDCGDYQLLCRYSAMSGNAGDIDRIGVRRLRVFKVPRLYAGGMQLLSAAVLV